MEHFFKQSGINGFAPDQGCAAAERMEARERVQVTVKFACAAPPVAIFAAAEAIAVGLSSISAGATYSPIVGVWHPRGALDLERYDGPVAVEPGVAITIVVPVNRFAELIEALSSVVEAACKDLPVRWVDTLIQYGGLAAAHFQIKAG